MRNFLQPVVGGFAEGAARVPTVAMIHAAFRRHKLNWRYLNCEIDAESLGAAVAGARAMGWRGFDCAGGLATAVLPHLDRLTDAARILRAAPIVRIEDGVLTGMNPEGADCLEAIRGMRDPAGSHVLVLGATGPARAVAVELALAGAAEITVADLDQARGEDLAMSVAVETVAGARFLRWQGPFALPDGTDIVLSAGPVAEAGDEGTPWIDMGTLAPGMIVANLEPAAGRRPLIAAAVAQGCRTVRGRDPAIARAAAAFRAWTGIDPDRAEMARALSELGL
ncbi:shikimate dehydrogenase [Rhodobacterales bacterium HKCCE2091]|nr:shikimate dehydrogenase [Rhodobacterales bacterium HKCCE2091]